MTIDKNSERSKVKEIITELYNGTKTIDDVKANDLCLYLMNMDLMERAVRTGINDKVKTPKWRLNLLFAGKGGTGKTTLANLIAQELDKKEEHFTFTDCDAGFNDYANDDIVIWDEMRDDLIKDWGIAKFLTATNNSKFNNAKIKILYGVCKLAQHYNFLTTSQEATKFLMGLTDRHYTDKDGNELSAPENDDQISRRFPYFIQMHFDQVDYDNRTITIDFYQLDLMEIDYNNFTNRYKKVKSWTIENSTMLNYEEKLKPIAKSIADAFETLQINTRKLA